ncbi:NADPH-dependent F420 reductase [Actinomadura livida]|uniref:NAD(P)-binding domain-containing protein n=1 Tax=Actinomadura livida TaxID=79909 RepID=A0A7W7MXB8_9ACTN|nr:MULTISPECIES: NAD(P)-binding domain-containing protein [Actinomadura]MBB4774651.1 NADPH-dependent F420 reductase [Actinomadura catellatispora]GGU06897.1 NADPH-dependent F420 reductase [Actinomadura livida]
MKIGILGTGRMGVRLAAMYARAGHDVVLGSRDTARADKIAAGLGLPGLTSGDRARALDAPVVLPAIFLRDGLLAQLEPLRETLRGRILIDITNPFNADYSDFITPWDTSGAEQIAATLPDTRVVGAFKNVWWEVFDKPDFGGLVSDVYVVSDDADAKRQVIDLGAGTPFRYVDAGRLANARTVERMTLLSGELGTRLGYFPRMNYALLGERWQPGQADRVGGLIARPTG